MSCPHTRIEEKEIEVDLYATQGPPHSSVYYEKRLICADCDSPLDYPPLSDYDYLEED